MKKGVFFALPLVSFLFHACSAQHNQWKLASIKANCPDVTYVKAYLPTCNPFNGLEPVFLSSRGNLYLYLNALTLYFPLDVSDSEHCAYSLIIESENYRFIAERLQGGQCLLLREDAKELIVNALLEKKCVEIRVGRYQAVLNHENFDKAYLKLMNLSR